MPDQVIRHIEAWRNRTIEGEFPYAFLDGVVLKRSWAGEVRDVSARSPSAWAPTMAADQDQQPTGTHHSATAKSAKDC
jgi:hypothetical protein